MLVSELEERLVYWMRRTFENAALENFVNEEFIDILNQVARDFNAEAGLWKERYYKKTTAGETNYELQGKIVKVLYFYYEADDYDDQYYTFIDDVIVLKESPDETYQMDIFYIRDIENVALVTDEIDLPDMVMHDFIDLVKKRLKTEFGVEEEIVYQNYLQELSIRVHGKLHAKQISDGILRYWLLPELDDRMYVITEHWVSEDSVYADVAGDYHFIPDE